MSNKSRRSFLKGGAALAAGAAAMRGVTFGAVNVASTAPRPTRLMQFDYADVQLLDGPMQEQFKHNHELFLNLDEDSMLKPFRQLTGMPAPGEDMGGWYSPSNKFDPPKDMTGYIPGAQLRPISIRLIASLRGDR